VAPESGYQAGSGEAGIEQAAKASARLADCFFLSIIIFTDSSQIEIHY